MKRFLNIAGIALVFLATAAGAALANLYASSGRHHRSAARFIAISIVAGLVAGGIVLRDEIKGRARIKPRLGSRVANGFSHGFAWRGAGDALELFAELLVGG